VIEYENRIVMLSQELDRTNEGSRIRDMELEKAQKTIRDL
jgi:hypothetical protein